MNKEVISDRQAICMVVLFITGDAMIYPTAVRANQDIWLSIILSIIIATPMLLIFVRLHILFSAEDLFSINESIFGKFLGKIINLLFIYYTAINVISIMRGFSEYTATVSFPETPKIVTILLLVFVSTWVVKEGIEVLSRFSAFFLLIIISLIITAVLLLVPEMDIDNILPVFYDGIKPVFEGAFTTFIFPLSETLVLTMIFSSFKTKKSPYRIYLIGLIIGGFLILITSLSEILVLGIDIYSSSYFPSYSTVSKMNIGDLLQRLEIVVSITYIVGGFVKISVMLLAVTKGITKIFNFNDYRLLVIPTALIMANASLFIFDSLMHHFNFIEKSWYHFALLFQVGLPIIIWIAAEIKRKGLTNNQFN